MYGEKEVHPTVSVVRERTEFEYKLAKCFMEKDKPILGICGGMQLINVMTGGTLIQDIPSQFETETPHYDANKDIPIHDVEVMKDTKLYSIVGKNRIGVNTSHHQAVKAVGKEFIVNAIADDGLVEGIEHTKMKFCIGVQWHPEYVVTEADFKIIEAFVNACRT